MAIKKWISGDGNGSSAGAWSTGTVLADNDFLVFDGTSQRDWSSGFDHSLISLKGIFVSNSYRGQIGFPGNALEVDFVSGFCTHEGTGKFYLDEGTTASNCEYIINSPTLSEVFIFGSKTGNNAGKLPDFTVKSGRLTINETAPNIGLLRMMSPRANAFLEDNGTAGKNIVSQILLLAGDITTFRTATTGRTTVLGGTLTVNTPLSGAAIANLVQFGGRTIWNSDVSRSGSNVITVAQIYGGTLDFSRTSDPKKVGTLHLLGNSIIHRGDQLIVTTGLDYRATGTPVAFNWD